MKWADWHRDAQAGIFVNATVAPTVETQNFASLPTIVNDNTNIIITENNFQIHLTNSGDNICERNNGPYRRDAKFCVSTNDRFCRCKQEHYALGNYTYIFKIMP